MQVAIPSELLPRATEFLLLLEKWNRTHALTALAPETRMEELILDAMAVLPFLAPLPAGARVVDFGSGMGVPAIPVALARPDLEILALDASAKKVAFVRQAVLELGIANVRPLHARAERLEPLAAQAGMAKAVGDLSLLLGWWQRHGAPGAPFYAFKGAGWESEGRPEGWHAEGHPYHLPTRGDRFMVALTPTS